MAAGPARPLYPHQEGVPDWTQSSSGMESHSCWRVWVLVPAPASLLLSHISNCTGKRGQCLGTPSKLPTHLCVRSRSCWNCFPSPQGGGNSHLEGCSFYFSHPRFHRWGWAAESTLLGSTEHVIFPSTRERPHTHLQMGIWDPEALNAQLKLPQLKGKTVIHELVWSPERHGFLL